ncbi:NlpC/P60 family protein [Bailinhaonella thermotolerans]|uniref:NlpC/P60 family protein n=1 Tax=Bailinhaonella thermotolerans TaxID=1070861 RepID=A0A3A4BJS6_9ACTN|nr:NlpC/P60 family protein [Bailinhaonella thermotolerans]
MFHRARGGLAARALVGLGLAAALVIPAGAAGAEPKPTIKQVKAKLEKLNDQVDVLVDRYNAANSKWKSAKAKADKIGKRLAAEEERAEAFRAQAVTLAVSAYQGGAVLTMPGLVVGGDPEAMLGSAATLTHLSDGRAASVAAYEEALKGLREQREEAQAALKTAAEARRELGGQKATVERAIKEQLKLLRKLGPLNPGDPNSPGQKYTGPASGNARAALDFAYAQIGKPYRYGGTGPDSWDCSGLTQASWAKGGVSLPRTTTQQWAWGASRRVPMDALEPGDLLFNKGLGHVGMYAGDGKMVHAPRTGDVVKVVTLSQYGMGRFLGAIRP